ncbi:hypothetical protein Tco_1273520 [Tanacetum coccineum]
MHHLDWKYHLHANVVRFQRPQKPNAFIPKGTNLGSAKSSFASVLKEGNKAQVSSVNTEPALVLDESCIKEYDFSSSLMGKIKDVSAMPNLYTILSEEGFQNIKITYLGGMWVLLELDSIATKEKFLNHTGVGSWFTIIKQASDSFKSDERIIWVSIEGGKSLFKVKCFGSVLKKWTLGLQPSMMILMMNPLMMNRKMTEDIVDDKDANGLSDIERGLESSFIQVNDLAEENSNNSKTGDVGTQSEDPFNIYEMLNGHHKKASNSSKDEPEFPLDLHLSTTKENL